MLCISFRKCALYFLKKRLKGKGKKKKIQFSSWIKNREIMKWVICSQCLLYLTGETWSGPPFLLCCDTFPPFPWYSPVLPNRTPFLQHPESNSQGRSPPLHHRLCSARCPASHSLRSCKATSTTVASSQVPVMARPFQNQPLTQPLEFAEGPSTPVLEMTRDFLFRGAQMALQWPSNSASWDPALSSRFFYVVSLVVDFLYFFFQKKKER